MLDPCDLVPDEALPAAPLLSWSGLAGPLIQALLDELDEGIVLCDARRRPLLLNRAARSELERGDPLRLDAGRLTAQDHGAAEWLESDLREVSRGGARRLRLLPGRAGRLFVTLLPMPGHEALDGLSLLLIGRRTPCREAAIDLLAEMHGLTSSERSVLGGLVEGLNPSDIAIAKGVELSTVRTQISAVRAKLGADSIEGVTRLVATLPSVLPPTSGRRRPVQAVVGSLPMALARAAWMASPMAGPLAPRAAAAAAIAVVSTASAAASAARSRATGA